MYGCPADERSALERERAQKSSFRGRALGLLKPKTRNPKPETLNPEPGMVWGGPRALGLAAYKGP